MAESKEAGNYELYDDVANVSDVQIPQSDYIKPCGGPVGMFMKKFWNTIGRQVRGQQRIVKYVWQGAIYAVILAYLIGIIYTSSVDESVIDWCKGYGLGFILYIIVIWFYLYYYLIKPGCIRLSPILYKLFRRWPMRKIWFYSQCVIVVILIIGFVAFAVVDTASNRRRLLSLGGWVVFILFGFVCSKHPEYIRWRTVAKGLILQVVIGIITIKWETGRYIFACLGEKVEKFLEYSYAGAGFIYGDLLVNDLQLFAFRALSTLYFMAMIVQILFYFGWIQIVCLKVGGLIQFIMGTTIIESVNAISTIFLGMNEVPFIYRTYIPYLTKSELHAIIAACFAAVSGEMLAAYASLGVDPSHVVTASSMAAPAALAFSKLFFPENRKTYTSSDNIVLHKSDDSSIMDAACKGAFSAIEIIQGIIANMIACISFIAFLDGMLSWFGGLVGVPQLTFEYLLGKVFIPLAWLMGVELAECEDVARLIGLKTTVNEFVAYKELGLLKKAHKLTPRSEAIATFALCGFANPGSVSIMLATLSGFAPNQRSNIISVMFRAFVAGSCTSFMSACIVGLLMPESGFGDEGGSVMNITSYQ